MKTVLIVNGLADASRRAALLAQVEQWRIGRDVKVEWTRYPEHATHIARHYALQKEPVHLFSCGGDGLLHEIVNGIVHAGHVLLSICPIGTGNDFVKSFPEYELADFLDLTRYERPRHMACDVLCMHGEYAINTISFGFDVHVAKAVNECRKKFPGTGIVPYTFGMAKSLLKPLNVSLSLAIDGVDSLKKDYAFVVLGNGRFYGGGYQPCPDGQVDDGKMDVCLIHDIQKYQIVRFSKAYARGEHVAFEKIVTMKTASLVHVDTNGRVVYANMDGEVRKCRDPWIGIVPGAVRLALPARTKE